jgi:hypothetical protein
VKSVADLLVYVTPLLDELILILSTNDCSVIDRLQDVMTMFLVLVGLVIRLLSRWLILHKLTILFKFD